MEDPDGEQQAEQGQGHRQQSGRDHGDRRVEDQEAQAQHQQVESFQPDLAA